MSRHTEPPEWSSAIAALGVSFQKMQVTIDDQALAIEEKDGIIADQAQRLDQIHAREDRLLAERDALQACLNTERTTVDLLNDKLIDTDIVIMDAVAERETLRARIRELTDRLDGTDAAAECEDWVAI